MHSLPGLLKNDYATHILMAFLVTLLAVKGLIGFYTGLAADTLLNKADKAHGKLEGSEDKAIVLLDGEKDDDEYKEDEEENEEEYYVGGEGGEGTEELAESLGSIAWSLGLVVFAGFALYRHLYPRLVKMGVRLPLPPNRLLGLHMAAGLLLGIAALIHGALLISYAGPIEYIAAGLTALVVVWGIVLYFARGRTRYYRLLIQVKRVIALLVLIAVAIHVAIVD